MTYKILLTPEAERGIEDIRKAGETAALKKLGKLFDELQEHPATGTGKPERLKHDFTGYWSRRITKYHRIVYQIQEETVTVIVVSVFGHYER